jgi:hypothetical protein
MSKIYLCGITTVGKYENLKELIDPIISYFDGLIWTFHDGKDEGSEYLEANKKDGAIIYTKFSQRHGFSMQQYLWQGPMQDGDYFVQVDDQERLSFNFCAVLLPTFIEAMETHNIAMIANYGKGLIFRYNEQLEFKGSPHWYATNLDGPSTNVELVQTDFWNVRNKNRSKFQFVDHYAKYYLYPAGSNHSLLGLDHHPQGNNFFVEREKRRIEFRNEMKDRGYPLTVDGLKNLFINALDDKIKDFINKDLILNDFYRYYILKDETLVDSHNWSGMIKI